MKLSFAATLAFSATATALLENPTIKLANGIDMPLVALGVWQYDNETAADAIAKGLALGYTHIDTAYNYNNQQGVGKALKGKDRNSFFLTTKTPPCMTGTADECYQTTKEQLQYDLDALQMDHVDLVLIHGSSGDFSSTCDAHACEIDYAQYRAYEDFYAAGKTRAIGLSNYCVSCLDCLLSKNLTVAPVVNQIQYHVGMGSDDNTQKLLATCEKYNIVPQAYSPLGNGKLISDPDLTKVAGNYNKTNAQIALKWIVSQNIPLATKADDVTYLTQDLSIFSWNLTDTDMDSLTKKDSPVDRPSWSCTA